MTHCASPDLADLYEVGGGDGEEFWGTAKARHDFSLSIAADLIKGLGQIYERPTDPYSVPCVYRTLILSCICFSTMIIQYDYDVPFCNLFCKVRRTLQITLLSYALRELLVLGLAPEEHGRLTKQIVTRQLALLLDMGSYGA